MTCRTLEALVHVSDATIYRPNDISSRYWPYRIVSISSRKNIEISIYRYRFDTFQYRRNDAYSMLPVVCIFTRLSGDYGRLAYLCRTD